MILSLASFALGACQLVAGLGDLEPSAASAGGATSSSGLGPGSSGSGGSGDGGGAGHAGAGGAGGSGGGCATAECQVQVLHEDLGDQATRFIAIDAEFVYFGGGSIQKAPLGGGGTPALISEMFAPISGLAVDSTRVWLSMDGDHGGVYYVLKSGAGGRQQTSFDQGKFVGPIAINAGHIYWILGPDASNPGDPVAFGLYCENADMAADVNGPNIGAGPAQDVGAIVFAGGRAYWHEVNRIAHRPACPNQGNESPETFEQHAVGGGLPFGLATDGEDLYWTILGDQGAVYREPLAGGTAALVASNQPYPRHVAAAGAHVYWSTGDASCSGPAKIHRVLKDGAGGEELVWEGMTCPTNFAQDSDYLYWAEQGTIYRIPITN